MFLTLIVPTTALFYLLIKMLSRAYFLSLTAIFSVLTIEILDRFGVRYSSVHSCHPHAVRLVKLIY